MFRIRKAVFVAAATMGLLVAGAGAASADSKDACCSGGGLLDDVDVDVSGLLNDLDTLNDVIDGDVLNDAVDAANDVADVGDVANDAVDANVGPVAIGKLGVVSVGDVLNGNNILNGNDTDVVLNDILGLGLPGLGG